MLSTCAWADVSRVWVADQGNGTYINPVIHADYSDPDAIAAADGSGFYMTASSFQCTPGLPILFSKDLVNWEIVNYALERLVPEEFYATPRHGKGVWAPSIRYHAGKYYIFWGDPDFGIYMVSTDNPRGKWSEPMLVKAGKGLIDPTPLWDEDGKAYLVNGWAASRAGFNSVLTVWEMKPDGTELIGNPVMVYDGNADGNHTVEGPKFYRHNGYYYILCPAGGVVDGWQLALRSKSPFGPYESKVVMSQGKTTINGPHQGAMIDTPAGESWFLHFQDKGVYGRVIHLNPIKWDKDWPVMGNNGQPVDSYRKPAMPGNSSAEIVTPQESDEFSSRQLGLQWEWHANYQPTFGFTTDLGFMRINGYALSPSFVNFWEVPNLLLQKFPAPAFTATAKVKISAKSAGQQSGLIVMGHDYCRLTAEFNGKDFELKQITCHDAEQAGIEESVTVATVAPTRSYAAGLTPNSELSIWLRVKVEDGGQCRFSYSLNGKKYTDCPASFQARQGKWIGAKVGMFSVHPATTDCGWIDIDSFIIDK
jgi:beta-xylosidase